MMPAQRMSLPSETEAPPLSLAKVDNKNEASMLLASAKGKNARSCNVQRTYSAQETQIGIDATQARLGHVRDGTHLDSQ
jgi:hypothetical protein